jgi:hypothetical protein
MLRYQAFIQLKLSNFQMFDDENKEKMIKNTLQQAQNIDFLKIKCNNSVPGLVS